MAHDTELGTREVRTGMTVLAVLTLALVWAAARKFLVPGAPTTAITSPAADVPSQPRIESPVYVEAARPALPWDGPTVNFTPSPATGDSAFASPVVPITPPLDRPAVPIPIPQRNPATNSPYVPPSDASLPARPLGKIRDAPVNLSPPPLVSPEEGALPSANFPPDESEVVASASMSQDFSAQTRVPPLALNNGLPPREDNLAEDAVTNLAAAARGGIPPPEPSRQFPTETELPTLAAQASALVATKAPLESWEPESEVLPIRERLRLPGWITLVSADDIRAGRDYLVEEGDSLATIARYELGDRDMWPLVFVLNRHAIGDDPNRLRLGTWLKLPEVTSDIATSEDWPVIDARSDHILRK